MYYIEKLNVQDELIEGTQKFRITKNDGTVLADNCTIELVTILLQQGTEINKVLFDKIDANFEGLKSSMLGFNLYNLIIQSEGRF